ncbi:hypothetical protein [uncultured Aquimarina sp.]|uniref:hypothetical protein n=1 Tax=uncultured Aquimarina sp. TaxID=575652 RepID=UPI0026333345|nr:hypothetical protein [uncultured Aquimarina sp.]
MPVEKKHITKIIKLEDNGEFKRVLGDYELHSEVYSMIEEQLNEQAKYLIHDTVKEAKTRQDKNIVRSHFLTVIEKLNKQKKNPEKSPIIEGMKIIGTLALGACITHSIYVSQNDNISINFVIVFSGIIGALMLGISLYKK